MGTNGDGNEAADKVTMDDLKTLETTLLKSFEAKMEEMNQTIARLTSSHSPISILLWGRHTIIQG